MTESTRPTYKATGAVADYIFPIALVEIENGYMKINKMIGTGFIIGNNSFALTCAHVMEQCMEEKTEQELVHALFWTPESWFGFPVEKFEKHSSEDVAVIKISGKFYTSLQISDEYQNSSVEYHCWGYPHLVGEENQKLDPKAQLYPDLIFTQGYIRRRLSKNLPLIIYRGEQFYELSEQVGGGNSGAPVILKSSVASGSWKVIGVYMGEREQSNISYAVRAEAFADWMPEILGRSIKEESCA